MRLRYYSLRPGVPLRVSPDSLPFEQRRVLLDLGMLEEKWVTISPMGEPPNGVYEDCDCTILLESPDMGVPYVPPEPFDGNLTYAASKGLALFPFQEIGVEKMLSLTGEARSRNGDGRGGVLLFDEMGLGKTMEALAFVARLTPAPRKVLVICPNTLKIEWKKAVETWLGTVCGECGGTGKGDSNDDERGSGGVAADGGEDMGIVRGEAGPTGEVGKVIGGWAGVAGEDEGGGLVRVSEEDKGGEGSPCGVCRGGGIRVAVYATRRGGLKRFRDLPTTPGWTTAPLRFLITNYETMRTPDYMEILQAFNPDVLIFDEAHRLRNWERKTARVSKNLTADVEIAMTGTPVVNHAGDLWSLISRVAPGLAGSAYDFEARYTYSRRGAFGAQKMGVRNAAELKLLLGRVGIQRKKEEVLKDLPPKIYREVPLEMENGQRELYEQMERQLFIMLDSGLSLMADSVLAQMTRLRQLCCDPRILGVGKGEFVTGAALGMPEDQWEEMFKVGEIVGTKTEFLLELLEDLGGEQVVVFSNFEQYISLLEVELGKVGWTGLGRVAGVAGSGSRRYVRVTGKEVGDQRSLNIEEFQKGSVQVLLGTTQAGGEGVNLQVASRVVLMDRWWSPVRNEQAIDRLHRIGQVDSVQAILPHCVDTIDDALKEILHRKYSVINELRIQGDTVALMKEWRGRRS